MCASSGHTLIRKGFHMTVTWRGCKEGFDDLRASIVSWVGHSRRGDSEALREQIFAVWCLIAWRGILPSSIGPEHRPCHDSFPVAGGVAPG